MPTSPQLALKAQELATERASFQSFLAGLKDDAGNYKTITPEVDQTITTRQQHIETLEADYKRLEKLWNLDAANDEGLKAHGTVSQNLVLPNDGSGRKAFTVPARARYASIKHFKGSYGGYEPEERAYRFGMMVWALQGNRKALTFCRDYGIDLRRVDDDNDDSSLKVHTEGVPTAGGVLVPEEFTSDIINLKEVYGKFRQNTRIEPMLYDTKHVPRRTGGVTASWTPEATAITESTMAWDYVNLVTKKLGLLSKISTELGEDALVNVADTIMDDFAWAIAYAEDQAAFLGDGTPTYGGITGLGPKFIALGTVANTAGIVIAPAQTGGNGYGAIRIDDLAAVVGRLPQYAVERDNCKWYMSRDFYYGSVLNLMLKAGGVTEAEIVAGQVEPRLMGYPVVIVQVMPRAFAVSQIVAYFGSLPLASMLGDRRAMTFATSAHLNFDQDLIALRATERLDISIHDVGNNNASAALRIPGPIVALMTNAT